ncbi:MAG: DUF2231 domain-containing protein [Nitrospirae bacterium]|nr:DUF2231 domain-containing protein [Nitrospirota bacterium]
MKSRLQFGGHPIHAMVVGFPIGLYTTALVCDGLYLVFHDPFWFRMAFWAIAFGLVTHLGAAATGLPDFLAIMREKTEARRPATSHLVFGVGLLVVQGLNLAVRNWGEAPAGGSIAMPVIVNVIGATLVGVQGWYGGELVYRHLIGVELPEPGEDGPHGKHKGKKHH